MHPISKEIEVWVANFVLMDYGSGALMAVPGHDQRDFEFAKKYNIKIKQVIDTGDGKLELDKAQVEKAYSLIQEMNLMALILKKPLKKFLNWPKTIILGLKK